MAKNRMFRGRATAKLIIRIEQTTIYAIDQATCRRPGGIPGNRSEFVRVAIEERLKSINLNQGDL